jgi:hypothetical protein
LQLLLAAVLELQTSFLFSQGKYRLARLKLFTHGNNPTSLQYYDQLSSFKGKYFCILSKSLSLVINAAFNANAVPAITISK